MKPKTLQEAVKYFAEPENCMKWLVAKRWPDGVPMCPTCGRGDATYLPAIQKWQCKSAHKSRQFSARVGTIFEDSPIPLEKWLVALWMVCNCKNGISSHEIHRTIGVTQKSAWFMLHRIRLAIQSGSIMKIGGSGSPVEIDETYIGGKMRNMHKDRKVRFQMGGRNNGNKSIIMGMLERGGNVRTMIFPTTYREKKMMHAAIHENVSAGSQVMTDEFVNYQGLSPEYVHEVINHMGKIRSRPSPYQRNRELLGALEAWTRRHLCFCRAFSSYSGMSMSKCSASITVAAKSAKIGSLTHSGSTLHCLES